MAKCVTCGAELPDGASFCENCGTTQPASNPYKLAGEVQDTDYVGGIYDRTKAPGHPVDQPDPMGFDPAAGGNMYGGNPADGNMYGGQDPYNNAPYGGAPNGPMGGGYVEPARVQNKTGAIIAIALVAVCAIGVICYFLFFRDGASNSPKGVAQEFIEAFEELDSDKLVSLFPSELAKDEDVATIKQMFQLFSGMGVKIKFSGVTYDVGGAVGASDIQRVKDSFTDQGLSVSFTMDEVRQVTVKGTLTAEAMGQTNSQDFTYNIIVAKIDGKWMIVGAVTN